MHTEAIHAQHPTPRAARSAACGLEDVASGHGFLDDLRLSCELAVTRVFDAVARVARLLVWMPEPGGGGDPRVASPSREPSSRGTGRRRSTSAVPDGPSVSFTKPRCACTGHTVLIKT